MTSKFNISVNCSIGKNSAGYVILPYKRSHPNKALCFFLFLLYDENFYIRGQPAAYAANHPIYPPAGLHTWNLARSHCTATSPSGFMCKPPLPRKDCLLQSWCPYNPLPPDAALVGRNLCSNPSRAT